MKKADESDFCCDRCKASVKPKSKFCPACGAPFGSGMVCFNHGSEPAEGVCVICSKPFCRKCGSLTAGIFFCDAHSSYEIEEGMARVFGSIDNVQAQYVTRCLEQAGYHPFLYSRYFNPGAGIVGTMTKAGIRNYGDHPIIEMKVLVPFSEVLRAEKTLRELGIREE